MMIYQLFMRIVILFMLRNYKVPIIVEESKNIIFFPTSSFRSKFNSWISLKHFNKCYKSGVDTIVEFDNQVKIKIDMSVGSFNNQVLRSSRLDSQLRNRKDKKDSFLGGKMG